MAAMGDEAGTAAEQGIRAARRVALCEAFAAGAAALAHYLTPLQRGVSLPY